MFDAIGTGKSGAPLVLAELNETEHTALTLILRLAEKHLDEIPNPRLRSRGATTANMIAELRRVHGIEED